MAITKTIEIPKIEVVASWNIQVATDTVIKEDDVVIGKSRQADGICSSMVRCKFGRGALVLLPVILTQQTDGSQTTLVLTPDQLTLQPPLIILLN